MIYAGFAPGSNVVVQVIVDPLPGDFAAGYVYYPVADWSGGLPQIGWVRNPATDTIRPAPPVPEGA